MPPPTGEACERRCRRGHRCQARCRPSPASVGWSENSRTLWIPGGMDPSGEWSGSVGADRGCPAGMIGGSVRTFFTL
jgi:hypothetical protein